MRPPRLPLGLLVLASLGPVAVPAAARADATTRLVSIDDLGRSSSAAAPAAVSPGGKEVLLNLPLGGSHVFEVGIRDVTTNRTTILTPGPSVAIAASSDLSRVLVESPLAASPADVNATDDLYVVDRPSGKLTLVSRDATGAAVGVAPWFVPAAISGDGKVVYWTKDASTRETVVDTGVTSTVGPGGLALGTTTDAKGTVVMAGNTLVTPTRKITSPGGLQFPDARVSVDGAVAVLFSNAGDPAPRKLFSVETATGTVKAVPLPSWLTGQDPILVGVTADHRRAVVGERQPRGAGTRLVVGTVDLTTGAVAQLGGDLPWVPTGANFTPQAITPDAAFVLDGPYLGQVGATPIPGTAPAVTGTPSATKYLGFDGGCRTNPAPFPYGVEARRPNVGLNPWAVAGSPRLPARADLVVKTPSGTTADAFSLTAGGAPRDLHTGIGGGFTVTAKVTFTDGTSTSETLTVKPYPTDVCPSTFGTL